MRDPSMMSTECCKCNFIWNIINNMRSLHRQQKHTQTKGGEIWASQSRPRSTQCQEGIVFNAADSMFTWQVFTWIITVILTDRLNVNWLSVSCQVKNVHSNGQSKAKATSQLLEPRNDKVGQRCVSLCLIVLTQENWYGLYYKYMLPHVQCSS